MWCSPVERFLERCTKAGIWILLLYYVMFCSADVWEFFEDSSLETERRELSGIAPSFSAPILLSEENTLIVNYFLIFCFLSFVSCLFFFSFVCADLGVQYLSRLDETET